MTRDTGYRYLDPAALARVKNLSMVARGVVEGFISGLHSSPYKGFSVEFAEHREYTRGDNLRFLDWRMLARTDRLYIKQYEEETNLKAQIILDTSGSMLYRHGKALSKLEYSAYLTAILAFLMTRQQDAVGLTTFDEQVRFDMPARTSPRHFGEMMRQLEGLCDRLKQREGETTVGWPSRPSVMSTYDRVKQREGETTVGWPSRPSVMSTCDRSKQRDGETTPAAGTNVGDTLHRLAERFKRRCLIILISDLYDDPDAVMRALHHFRSRKHEVILFHVFDETEIEFPFKETMRFVDMETGERLQIDPSYVREDYKRQIAEFIEFYRRSCADCQIDYVNTHTSVPYDLMLSRYLHKRGNI